MSHATFAAVCRVASLVTVLYGAFAWGAVAFGVNPIQAFADAVGQPLIATLTYTGIAISGVILLFSITTWLPFLGSCGFPCGSLVSKTPEGADTGVYVQVAPNSSVVFWAAEGGGDGHEAKVVRNPWMAYSEYSNTGVTRSDANGKALLKVRKPLPYRVPPFGAIKRPHVHYRTCDGKGLLGPVKSVLI